MHQSSEGSATRRARLAVPIGIAALAAAGITTISSGPISKSFADEAGTQASVWTPANATTLTTDLSDGSTSARVYSSPINYRAEDGSWRAIDNTLVDSSEPGVLVQNEANDFALTIPQDASKAPVKFEQDGNWISMRMEGVGDAPADVSGPSATFPEVEDAASVTYTVTDDGVKEDIVLNRAPGDGPLQYRYVLRTSVGVTPALQSDGSISFTAGSDFVASIPAGVMIDSAESPDQIHDVDFDLENVRDRVWSLTVTPSLAWLNDSARVYPVRIDPSLSDQPTRDCWIYQATPNTSRCGSSSVYLKAGYASGGHYRSLLKFNLGAIPANVSVTSASINLYLDATQTTTAQSATYGILRLDQAFSTTATWNSSGYTAWSGGSTAGGLQSSLDLGGQTSGYKVFDGVEPLVQDWLDGFSVNQGVLLKQVGTAAANVLSFGSSSNTSAGKKPFIAVDYEPIPSEADALAELAATESEVFPPAVINSAADAAGPVTISPALGAGEHLKRNADGTIVVVDAAGTTKMSVAVADATDASGATAPSAATVSGDSLIINVSPAAGLTYPLVVQVVTDAPVVEKSEEPQTYAEWEMDTW
ncbi:DNRLRE domain-containing protein [Nocardioides marmotae]|uniref:DNRLRE domain-containing protein n=1 Tax=Nocardioides marmotae TaxID=2663857 RepID=A0A6I3J548_9ACTN|nr:DNRLRE domain-containing protein [Nocardioides marmotae]MCR6030697.1 DNRLRE domain-containing protein [Gordonia jinghuaiqii]MBC9735535.1 DNRLRE domain-containing protein [Nocardioides marmotae]MTB86632.1 DNRLRE domain-containing protein [Nocardioides marmotae]MTB94332.1 DNRLRE domain-containing protein [Nocardioides marmotae]QKE01640.1 DNRLRE domain-containing protein [Nocardioides marmotae]